MCVCECVHIGSSQQRYDTLGSIDDNKQNTRYESVTLILTNTVAYTQSCIDLVQLFKEIFFFVGSCSAHRCRRRCRCRRREQRTQRWNNSTMNVAN